jgi:hypothetical protein
MRAKALLLLCLALAMLAILTMGSGLAWCQEPTAERSGEEGIEQAKEVEKAPPKLPEEAPGYFPKGVPSPAGSLELSSITTALGPASGVLAPYGNPAAYDTLQRGWNIHKLGPFNVSPFLEYDGIYRSNIFQTSSDKKSDYINNINPGVHVELPIAQRHKLSLGYLGNFFIYSTYSDQSHYDQNVNLEALLNFRGGLSLLMGNAFRYAVEEPSGTEPRSRPYIRDTPYFRASYRLADKWRAEGFYQFDLLNFSPGTDNINNLNSYQEQAGGVSLYYKFWPKTSALVQYIMTSRTYPDSPESNSITYSPLIGLTFDPTAKISGTVKVGYTFVNYTHEDPSRTNSSPSGFAMSMNTLYRCSRYTRVSLTLQRSKQDDIDTITNSPFWNTGVFVNLSHDWHRFKATSYVGFAYQNNSYINQTLDVGTGEFKKRVDNLYFLNAGVSRPLTRWLRARLDYSYIDRSSNISGNSYNDNRFLFGLQTSF